MSEYHAPEEVLGKAYDGRLIKRLWAFVVPHWKLLIAGLLLIPAAVGFELAQPYLLKIAIDDHIAAGKLDGLGGIALAYVALVTLKSFTSYGQLYSLQLLGQRAMHDLRVTIYDHVIRQRRGFFDDQPVGRLLTRMTNDVETINEVFASGVVTLIADVIKLVAIIGLMFALNPQLTVIVLLTFPLLIAVIGYARQIMRRSFREIRVKVAAMNSFVQEHISGVTIIQLFRREREASRGYDELNRAHRDAYFGAIRADATMYAAVEAIGVCAAAGIAWYSGARIGETGLTVGLVVAFVEYINKFFIPVRDLSSKYTTMQSAMAACERVIGLLDSHAPDAVADPAHAETRATTGADTPAIEVCHIDFEYRPGQPVLRDVSLTVDRGSAVAIVGATGSGKSSIIKLLTRLYTPTNGTIFIDGRDVRGVPTNELRRQVTVVSQDVFLFNQSIAENVRAGSPGASDAEVRDALEQVGAYPLLARKGDDVLGLTVGERGNNFSSGERQLIAFARALIGRPNILVLDEATAHVDPEAEALIEEALARLMHGRTTLLIAHRLSTIRRADKIVVLSHGRVAEAGSHDELVDLGGLYSRLQTTFRGQPNVQQNSL